jgi:hypothetical protein
MRRTNTFHAETQSSQRKNLELLLAGRLQVWEEGG